MLPDVKAQDGNAGGIHERIVLQRQYLKRSGMLHWSHEIILAAGLNKFQVTNNGLISDNTRIKNGIWLRAARSFEASVPVASIVHCAQPERLPAPCVSLEAKSCPADAAF